MKDVDDAVSGIDIDWKIVKMNNSKIARTRGSLKKTLKRVILSLLGLEPIYPT